MTRLRGTRAALYQLRYDDVRRRSRHRLPGPLTPLGSRRARLIEGLKPWLIVAAVLLLLGLAGGLEQGTVWP